MEFGACSQTTLSNCDSPPLINHHPLHQYQLQHHLNSYPIFPEVGNSDHISISLSSLTIYGSCGLAVGLLACSSSVCGEEQLSQLALVLSMIC